MALADVVVEMMSCDFVLWRCLHGGPLSKETVDHPEPHPRVPWDALRTRNIPYLTKMIQAYGSCAVIARDGTQIVGQLLFYPKVVRQIAASGLCMQQKSPGGPPDDIAEREFPPLSQIADKTLVVYCLMTGSPQQKANPYQRQGVGSRMVRALIDWARRKSWSAVEATANADLPCLYAITGQAGKAFWEKLGFRATASVINSAFVEDGNSGFVDILLREAGERGMDAATARTRHTMRFELG